MACVPHRHIIPPRLKSLYYVGLTFSFWHILTVALQVSHEGRGFNC